MSDIPTAVEWLIRLAIDYRLFPLSLGASAVTFYVLGARTGKWLESFVFGFAIIFAAAWLPLVFYLIAWKDWFNYPAVGGGFERESMLIGTLIFVLFGLSAGLSGRALVRVQSRWILMGALLGLTLAHALNFVAVSFTAWAMD
jgi:hypothetical protein